MKGNIPKSQGGHHCKCPIKAGYPTKFSSFCLHKIVKENRINRDDGRKKDKKLGQEDNIPLGFFILKKIQELGYKKFHGSNLGMRTGWSVPMKSFLKCILKFPTYEFYRFCASQKLNVQISMLPHPNLRKIASESTYYISFFLKNQRRGA